MRIRHYSYYMNMGLRRLKMLELCYAIIIKIFGQTRQAHNPHMRLPIISPKQCLHLEVTQTVTLLLLLVNIILFVRYMTNFLIWGFQANESLSKQVYLSIYSAECISNMK